MVVRQITFVCDVCGSRLSFDENDIDMREGFDSVLPETWRRMDPYGDVCNKCCNELDGVYERIHAPMKAKEQYGHEYENKEKTRRVQGDWENLLFKR